MINLDDYLTDEEKKAICKEEFRRIANIRCQKDFERILSNAGYEMVEKEVNNVFDGKMADVIKEKAIEVINNMSSLTVFQAKDAWNREPSKGWLSLESAVGEAMPLIQGRVNAVVAEMEDWEFKECIHDRIAEAVLNKLASK